ncbi:MAG: CDP-alcohol phosphatidyltransferase family protein [Coriobacteriia bacterium]|nr:CDP-alcohol phosphatidyltransferase family protein [Coriobacteriia bacterium]
MVDETPKHTQAPEDAPLPANAEEHTHDIYTVANIITVLRLILVPFAFAVLINGRNNGLAFALFAVAASTDWLDGQIARRTGTVTAIGKAIDPLVDRLLLAAGVLGLYMVGRLPAWMVVVLFARDAYLMYGAWRLEQFHTRRMPVTFIGKLTTAVLLVGFADLILGWPMVPGLGFIDSPHLPGLGSEPVAVGIYLVYAGIALSLTAAVQYTFLFRSMVAKEASS